MICGIVLAAGESRRMGAQKVLLPFGGASVIAHIVDQLLNTTLDKVCVVVGHDGEQVAAELRGRTISIVFNPDPAAGMLSSVRCGLRALPEACEAVLIALGDQPAITSSLVDEMIRSFRSSDRGILVPLHDGKRGHPLLFSTRYVGEVLTKFDGVGLRGLLQAHAKDVIELDLQTNAVLSDMDYPEDYRRELADFENRSRKGRGLEE